MVHVYPDFIKYCTCSPRYERSVSRNRLTCALGPLFSNATNSALYLRTLLRALEWAARNSYDVRALLDTILATASSVRALYNVIFDW